MCKALEPELTDLTFFDFDDETIILAPPSPVFEIGMKRAIRVQFHEKIPLKVLAAFVSVGISMNAI